MAAERGTGGNTGGIGLGGILVIAGIVLMIVWSFWIGLIIGPRRADRLRRLREGQVVLRAGPRMHLRQRAVEGAPAVA
jgi:hypothetical protein